MTATLPPGANNQVDQRQQAVTGLVPPQVGEALIRDTWPGVLGSGGPGPAIARLSRSLSDTIILRPLAWLMLLPLFVKKITPFVGKRYVLTNRRLMVVRFGRTKPDHEVSLADVDDVRMDPSSFDTFYRAGTLDVVSKGQVVLQLPGVPDPETFRHAILNACRAWGPILRKTPPAATA